MTQSALARVHDFFQFRHHRGGRAIVDGVNADGLSPEPVDVEIANGVDRGLALRSGAQDEQDLAAGICSDRTRLGREALHQLDQRRARHVLDRDDRQAVSGFDSAVGVWAVDRPDRSVGRRKDAIADRVPNQHQIVYPQRVLENEKHVPLCDRTPGRQTYCALRARIDDVAHVENVAQDDFGDRRDRRILEIQRKSSLAVGDRRRHCDRFDRSSEVAGRRCGPPRRCRRWVSPGENAAADPPGESRHRRSEGPCSLRRTRFAGSRRATASPAP